MTRAVAYSSALRELEIAHRIWKSQLVWRQRQASGFKAVDPRTPRAAAHADVRFENERFFALIFLAGQAARRAEARRQGKRQRLRVYLGGRA
jgi:hypothetical protein